VSVVGAQTQTVYLVLFGFLNLRYGTDNQPIEPNLYWFGVLPLNAN